MTGERSGSEITMGVCYRPLSQKEVPDDAFPEQMAKFSKKRGNDGRLQLPIYLLGNILCQEWNIGQILDVPLWIFYVPESRRGNLGVIYFRWETVDDVKAEMANGCWCEDRESLRKDHILMGFTTEMGKAKWSQTSTLDFRKADFRKMRKILGKIPWAKTLREGAQDGSQTLVQSCLKFLFLNSEMQSKLWQII